MKDVLVKLNADEPTFYAIAAKAWQECSDNQKDFVSFNSIYTQPYISVALAALQAAKELPNIEARKAIQKRMKTILEEKVVVCNGLVQNLYVIIARTFPASQVESMRKEAGSSYYNSAAGGENRNSADMMYGMAAAFLVTYNDDMIKGNMPVTFPGSFAEAREAFTTAFTNYSIARDNVSKGSTAKNEANAAVHATLVSMLADGKAIYRDNTSKWKYFSYRELKKMVAGPGKTGIRFALSQAVTELPVANAVITMQPGNYTLYPDKKGTCTELVPAKTYIYTIMAPGMATVVKSMKITAGGVHRANVVLSKAEATNPALPATGNNTSDTTDNNTDANAANTGDMAAS